ncbi:MAG: hypothetical protein COA79_14010 [Planctomycetota bacterium]|nr:MAG: hypothetical protein COA79_14010 [Planctomycetota bacterium]
MKFINEIDLILHELSENNLNYEDKAFKSKFELLDDLFLKQFMGENLLLLNEMTADCMNHKMDHDVMSNRLIKFKREVGESHEKRVHIVSEIQSWLINHVENFHS